MLFRKAFLSTHAAACLAAITLTAPAWSGPTIDAWDLQRTQDQERIRVRWSEPAAPEIHEFPAARQVVVKIPGATIEDADRMSLDLESSPILKDARIQPVTMSNGTDGVQITLNLKSWREPALVSTARWLTVTYDLQGAEPARKKASGNDLPILRLSNEDLEALEADEFGSLRAPDTGAGQPGQNNDQPFATFFVPEDLSQEERQQQVTGVNDIGMVHTEGLLERQVDLEFTNADLQSIIRSIAKKLKLNIIMTPSQVRGQVTISLNNITLRDALEAILKSNNLAYKIEPGGIVRIVNREEVRGSEKELETRAVAINWLDAADVATVIDPFLSDDGEAMFSTQSNILIVKDVPENLSEIQDLIYRLDVPEKQVRMEARLVDLSENAQRDLGFQTTLTDVDGDSFIPFNTGEGVNPNNEALFYPNNVGVLGTANVTNPSLDWIYRDSLRAFGIDFNMEARLQAAEVRGEAITLATPTILSLNNVPAEIEIKRQIPYSDAVNTDQGSVRTIKFADIGTRVLVTPRITNNGYITMVLETEQKILVDRDVPTGGVPIVDERFATTSVTVKDDQTVVLGGLRQFNSLLSETGIPWLLRAPVVGWLFKGISTETRRLDLYLFVTPHIIKDPQPTAFEMGIYEKIDYNWDLPDYYFDDIRTRKAPAEENDPRIKYNDPKN